MRQEVEELEDQADLAAAVEDELALGQSADVAARRRGSRPTVGRSMPPARWSSVDLPLPDSPTRRHELAGADLEVEAVESDDLLAAGVDLRDRPEGNERARRSDPAARCENTRRREPIAKPTAEE